MKKRLLTVLLTICMVAGLSACGNNGHKFANITIEGEKYNLSQDFEEVVKALNENDVQVCSFTRWGNSISKPYVFDEDCKLVKSEGREDIFLYADYAPVSKYRYSAVDVDVEDLVIKSYVFYGGAEYITASGIEYDSDSDDLKDLKGYSKMDILFNYKQTTYGALYVDGKIVDLEKYEDEFEEWKDYVDENGFGEAMEEYLPNRQYYHLSSRIWSDMYKSRRSYSELKDYCEDTGMPLKNVILTNFAMHDAGEKLEDGKIESYTLVRYETTEDDEVFMQYLEYSMDEDWDEDDYK
ncbi:MAG: hypothetical protein IKL22_05370 [Lachnospiraceae bacterium]|nr:hypothetical protein [Lachnospiraceae bacterium]